MDFVRSHWSGKKVSQKCPTGQSFIFFEVSFYKIHILVNFFKLSKSNLLLLSLVSSNFSFMLSMGVHSPWLLPLIMYVLRYRYITHDNVASPWKTTLKSSKEILKYFFPYCPELPRRPKQKNLCSKMWLYRPAVYKTGY